MRVAVNQIFFAKSDWSSLCLAALLWVTNPQAFAATLYKWIDENGAVHYSSSLPPDQSKKSHQQLNSQGVVLTTREAAKTAEELAQEAEAQRKLEEEQAEVDRLKKIQDQQDRVLLLTFNSEEEIENARDNRMSVIDSVIRLIENSVRTTQEQLDQLKQSAQQNYTSQGKEIPGGLAQRIEFFEHKIKSRSIQLAAKNEEKEKIFEKYQFDLERYRLLKSASN